MNIVIRADASSQVGIGHVMRCLTLASELKSNGCDISFVCKQLNGDMNNYIYKKGFKVHVIKSNDWQEDADYTREILATMTSVDWLVVDHYQLDQRWESRFKDIVGSTFVIDDLANRAHNCDLLLDQNYYCNMNTRYESLLPKQCITLLGPAHVLFRKEFRELLSETRFRDGSISKILIFLGGGDSEDITSKAIHAVRELDNKQLLVDVVVGSSNPLKEKIKQDCELLSNFSFYCQIENMAELISQADLCIGAGGTTTWERGVLGLPTLTVVCADNQYNTTIDLADLGAIKYLGRSSEVSVSIILNQLLELINAPEEVLRLSKAMIELMGDNFNQRMSTSTQYLLTN